jgi:hypothetical protein
MKPLEGTYISNRQGEEVKVTDFEEALKQAKEAVTWNQRRIIDHKTNKEVIPFPEALADWEHILLELQKLEQRLKGSRLLIFQ